MLKIEKCVQKMNTETERGEKHANTQSIISR